MAGLPRLVLLGDGDAGSLSVRGGGRGRPVPCVGGIGADERRAVAVGGAFGERVGCG